MTTRDEEERRTRGDADENDPLSSDLSDSEDDLSDNEGPPSKIEWLATGREKRSTAGNRMKSMIAAEEPDDELELLFAEDADDAGFTEIEDDGSDAQMSSSEDEEAQDNADELEGEKELEKRAHESRQAARKRKAQEAIPLKFRKKVRIDTSQRPSASATPAPKPRPRKKSERLSWLPSPADMPTRASKRETTMAGKEQLHKQMAEREVKRLQQIEAMERKAKKMAALKKPPMTQAERLAEAALVEKRNAKSLNRWEEAEKQREEERKAKLAALNNRTLEGPVVTFWSGVGEWIGGKLKHVGKIVTIEEKPAKKKRHSTLGHDATAESPREDKDSPASMHAPEQTFAVDYGPSSSKGANSKPEPAQNAAGSSGTGIVNHVPLSTSVEQKIQMPQNNAIEMASTAPHDSLALLKIQEREPPPIALNLRGPDPIQSAPHSHISPPTDIRPPDLKPPDLQPPSAGLYTSSMFAPPTQSSLMLPSELKPPSNSFLAPPMGVAQNGLSMPMIGYHPSLTSTSNVLAPPNPAQRQSPLSMPQPNIHPPPSLPLVRPMPVASTPKPAALVIPSTSPSLPYTRPPLKASSSTPKPSKANAQRHQSKESVLPRPPSPPADGKATRNCIILQNFNESAVKDKSVQTRILFNREMNKLPKQGPAVRCVITSHPARYKDPKTGLPYYNAYAFKQIQKLYSGEYKWSSLIGAWIGTGTTAATGVPARFMDPDAPGLPKEQALPDSPPNDTTITEHSNKDTTPQTAYPDPALVSVLRTPQPSQIAAPATASQLNSTSPATTDGPSIGPGKADASFIANEPSSTAQPFIPTTEATFALNPAYATASDIPIAGTAESGAGDHIDEARSTNVVSIFPDFSGPPATNVVEPATSSSAHPIVAKQEEANS
ncbi:YL1 nuclear protein-domain-containing protein [Nemania sp. NC0429]|nr:YL1 nuclear protein-domain-containing protein [Nemania sp. NC0429]